MPAENFPVLIKHATARRLENLTAAIAALEAARVSGNMANARYLDAKDSVGRVVEAAWKAEVQQQWLWNPDYKPGDAERAALSELNFTGTPAPHLMKTHDRRAAAIGDTQAGRSIRALLTELTPLMDLLAHCKTIAVKRTPAAAAEAREAASPMRFVTSATRERIDGVLRGLTDQARQSLMSSIRSGYQKLLDNFVLEEAKNAALPDAGGRRFGFNAYEYSLKVGGGKSSPYARAVLDYLLEQKWETGRRTPRYTPRADHPERMHEMAGRKADEMCEAYLIRTMEKLCPIVERKGNLERIEVVGNKINPAGMQAHLRVKFSDGSRFDARTSVVWSQSGLGNSFNRFPLTFHDVVMPDGTKLTKPSEERLNSIFAVTDPTPAAMACIPAQEEAQPVQEDGSPFQEDVQPDADGLTM